MIIHFIDDHVYCAKYISFIEKNFNIDEHLFVVFTKELKYIEQKNNIIHFDRKGIGKYIDVFFFLKKHKNDKLIFHYLNLNKLITLFLIARRSVCYWILWGGDFYSQVNFSCYDSNTKELLQIDKKHSLRENITKHLFKFVLKNKIDFIGVSEEEFKLIKKYTKTHAERVDFIFPNPTDKEYANLNKPHEIYNILLGNSADPSNNHLTILKMLSSNTSNFKVFVPLSYSGNSDYRDKIIKEGEKLLGQKFIPILKFMTPSEYSDFLSTIDVAIMNHYRQQALGNIRSLIMMGKKVYLNEINPLYEIFSNRGIKLCKIDNCFNDKLFDSVSDEIIENNKIKLEEIYSEESIRKCLLNIFQ